MSGNKISGGDIAGNRRWERRKRDHPRVCRVRVQNHVHGWCAAALSKAINDSPPEMPGDTMLPVDEIPDFHEFLERDANFYLGSRFLSTLLFKFERNLSKYIFRRNIRENFYYRKIKGGILIVHFTNLFDDSPLSLTMEQNLNPLPPPMLIKKSNWMEDILQSIGGMH